MQRMDEGLAFLLQYENGQRKLLTQTSEGGRRMPPSLVLGMELYTF